MGPSKESLYPARMSFKASKGELLCLLHTDCQPAGFILLVGGLF